jgi:hypothetical protein
VADAQLEMVGDGTDLDEFLFFGFQSIKGIEIIVSFLNGCSHSSPREKQADNGLLIQYTSLIVRRLLSLVDCHDYVDDKRRGCSFPPKTSAAFSYVTKPSRALAFFSRQEL